MKDYEANKDAQKLINDRMNQTACVDSGAFRFLDRIKQRLNSRADEIIKEIQES